MASSLEARIDQLKSAWKRLSVRWEETKTVWNDPVRWGVERKHWKSLESQVQAVLKEMDQIDQVISQARHSVK